jgi:hypothetical protein
MTSLLNKFEGMWHSILLFQVQRLFADLQTGLHALQWAQKVLQCLAILDYLQCGAIQCRNHT